MEYLNIQINIIEEIQKMINNNMYFDANRWCQNDANILKIAARIIEEGLKVKKSVNEVVQTQEAPWFISKEVYK